MKLTSVLLGTCLLTLVACGGSSKNKSENKSKTQSVSHEQERQEDPGVYRAVLKPLNSDVTGETSGSVEIRIAGDDFVAKANITGAPAGVKHLQNIMTGSACPDLSLDKNSDGVIDIKEGMMSFGKILIPLDSQLANQLDGMDFGPIANSLGNYVYRRSTGFSSLLADLQAPDPDKQDSIVKLPFGENLNLAGKVIVIHGAAAQSNLAGTVATIGELTPAQSIPIACGKIERVKPEIL